MPSPGKNYYIQNFLVPADELPASGACSSKDAFNKDKNKNFPALFLMSSLFQPKEEQTSTRP